MMQGALAFGDAPGGPEAEGLERAIDPLLDEPRAIDVGIFATETPTDLQQQYATTRYAAGALTIVNIPLM